ncbi:MAG: winged helix-turn-helix domain-containing protein [Candidatus Woesearchaeota archaeon]
MKNRVVLDYETIKALSYDTRLNILRVLKEDSKTLSEISESLDLQPSTIKEHLKKLLDSDLISKEDTDRKWKYYSLTKKGKKVVGKKEFNVKFMLFINSILAALFGFLFLNDLNIFNFQEHMPEQRNMMVQETAQDLAMDSTSQMVSNFPWFYFICFSIFLLILGIFIGFKIYKVKINEKYKLD